jgi:hypothetical protein
MRRIMARRTLASAGVLGGGNQPELVPKARAQAEDVTHLDTSKNPIQPQNGSKQIKDLAPAQATILGVFGGVHHVQNAIFAESGKPVRPP